MMEKLLRCSILTIFVIFYTTMQESTANSQIPLSMYKQQSQIKSTQQFVKTMVKSRPPPDANLKPNERNIFNSGTQTGFNDQSVAIMANQIAVPDGCDPRNMSVAIPPDSDPRVIYWPMCTKLEQCGGCCGHDALECVPTSSQPVTVQVMKQRLTSDGSGYDYMGNVNVELTRHLSCDCRCKVKAEDCNPSIQNYDEASCSCRCRNADLATSCQLPKRWDEKYCRCVCPNLINCLDDESFDFNTCSCVRGSLSADSAPAVPFLPGDPCLKKTCRAGLRAMRVGTSCTCRRARRSVSRHN